MGRPRKDPGQNLPKRMYLRHGAFFYVHHDGRWERLGVDLAIARGIADRYNAGAAVVGTMAYWLNEWVHTELTNRVKAGTLAKRTREDYAADVEPLKAFFGRMAPRAIEAKHITMYLELGRDNDRPVRANREKAALSSCLSWMVTHGHAGLSANPCKLVKRNREEPRKRYVSDSEYAAVFEKAPASVRAWMDMMYRTLQRPSDILKWTRKNLVTEAGKVVLEFRQSKTGAQMRIEVTATLQAAFDQLQANRKTASLYLISREDGRPYTEEGIASMMRRAVVAAGVKDFAAYDCKAKGATDMYVDGTPLEEISALCGHDSITTTEVYIKQHLQKVVKPNERVVRRGAENLVR